jgi:hypothetical protein
VPRAGGEVGPRSAGLDGALEGAAEASEERGQGRRAQEVASPAEELAAGLVTDVVLKVFHSRLSWGRRTLPARGPRFPERIIC